jgi:hypothetical protein
MEETIPSILNYQASQVLFRTNEFNVVPAETNGNPNGRLTFTLPQKSIINLSSIRVSFTNTVSGLLATSSSNYRNAIANCPVHTLIKSAQWRVGGTTVAGQGTSNNYGQIYHGLLRASTALDASTSKVDSGYQAMVLQADDADVSLPSPGEALNAPLKGAPSATTSVTGKSSRLVMSDILGMRNGNESYIDTSLYGDVQLILELAGNDALYVHSATAPLAGASYSLTDVSLNVKCVTSISPLYVELLANKLNSKTPIRWLYQNYTSTFANNTTGCTLSVNTNCLDMIMVQPFVENPDTQASLQANSVNSNRFKFSCGLTKANASNFRFQAKINNSYYPIKPISNALDVASITTEAMFGSGDINAQSQLFLGFLDSNSAITFTKSAFLTDNFVLIMKFCLQEGYVSKQLSGISSNGSQMNIDLAYSNCGTYQLVTAFYTSALIYDPSSGSIQIEA